MYRRRGDPIWVAVQGRAVNPDRPELGYIFAFVDIDKRKRSESELRNALSELQLIFDNSLVGMLYVANDLIVKANAATEQLFGYDMRDFSELQIGSLFAVPDQWETVRATAPASSEGEVDDIVEGDGAFSFERLMRRADGTTFWCAGYGRPIEPSAPERGMILTSDGRRRAPPVRGGIAPRPELPRPRGGKPSRARVRTGGRIGALREPQSRGRDDHRPDPQAGRGPYVGGNLRAAVCRPVHRARPQGAVDAGPRWNVRATSCCGPTASG